MEKFIIFLSTSTSSSIKWGYNSAYVIGLWFGLNEVIHVKCLAEFLVFNKSC